MILPDDGTKDAHQRESERIRDGRFVWRPNFEFERKFGVRGGVAGSQLMSTAALRSPNNHI